MAGGMNWERATQRSKISRNGADRLDIPSAASVVDRCFHEWSGWEPLVGAPDMKTRFCTECGKQQNRKDSKVGVKPAAKTSAKGSTSRGPASGASKKPAKGSSKNLIVSSGKRAIPKRTRKPE